MKEKIEKRVIRVTLRFNKSEFEKIQERMNNTRFRNTSSYFRYVLLEKKITTLYRNQSMDEEMEELIQLRKELNFIGHNYNQAVKKLNIVIDMPEAKYWQQLLTVSKNELEPCIRKIKDRINQFADLWSQKSYPEKV